MPSVIKDTSIHSEQSSQVKQPAKTEAKVGDKRPLESSFQTPVKKVRKIDLQS